MVYSVIVYPMIGFVNGMGSINFFYFCIMCVLMSATGRSWAYFLAAAIPIEAAASVVAPVTTVVFFLFAGYIIPRNSIPVGWRWFHYASFLTYPFRGLVINEFADRSLTCTPSELIPQPYHPMFNVSLPNGFGGHQNCPYLSGPAYTLATYDVDCDDSAWAQFWYTFVFYAAFTLIAIGGMSKIDHSSQAAISPPLIRDLGLRARLSAASERKHQSALSIASAEGFKEKKVFLTFDNLSYSVKAPGPMKADGTGGNVVEKQILHDTYGVIAPGRMMALMGASGAGKTTLLDVLAGRKTGGKVTGTLLINGKPRDQFFHRFSGYVEQFDSHLASSTVREAIRFSADTRLPPNTAELDKSLIVENAIQTLGLAAVADAAIGHPLLGGLSNELRKKITIAVELVMSPGLLFLDEPTTGLDASAALAVMTKVKQLASNISVICTIHQPSSTVLALFDDLLLLELGGRVAYHGPMGALPSFLAENKLGECPADQNISNFALKLLGSMNAARELDGKCDLASDVFLRSAQQKCIRDEMLAANTPKPESVASLLQFDSVMPTSVGTQLRLLVRRSLQDLFRDAEFLRARLFGGLTFAVMLGTLNYQMGLDVRDASARVSILFFACTTPVYSSQSGIPVVQSKRVMLAREGLSRMYHPSIFFIAEFLADLPLIALQSFVFAVPIYFVSGFRLDGSEHFWIFYASVVCLYLAGISMSAWAGYLFQSAPTATLVVTSLLTFMLLFMGFIIPYGQIPDGWIWMHFFNVFRYPLFSMITTELDGMQFACTPSSLIPVFVGAGNATCSPNPDFLDGYCWQSLCPLQNGNQILDVFSINPAELSLDCGLMVVLWAFFRLLAFLAFRFVNHVTR